jgi:hypothetical protein
MARMALRGPVVPPPAKSAPLELVPPDPKQQGLSELDDSHRALTAIEKLDPRVRAALERPFSRPMTAPCEVRLLATDWPCPLCYRAVTRTPNKLRSDNPTIACGDCGIWGEIQDSPRGGQYVSWKRGARR